jgi:ABC-type proline/glycine betaine transport system substrate-binding protein
MKKLLISITATVLVGVVGFSIAESAPSIETVQVGDVAWVESLEAAMPIAKREGKPILHLQMFGRLDDDFC